MADQSNAPGYVRDMTAEYVEKGGYVTCEFSCHYSNLGPVITAIHEVADSLLVESCMAHWVIFPCKTCEKQHGEGFLHVEIARFPEWAPKKR